jgi:guanylate kinase
MIFTSNELPILVIIGPSGAGKSTAVRKLVHDKLIMINPTWTTRPPRLNEQTEGIEHHFVSQMEFKQQTKQGKFLETVQMFGLPYSYGMMPIARSAEQVSAVMLRAALLPLFYKHYSNVIVYQISDQLERIAERLERRQSQGEPIGTRLSEYKSEVAMGSRASTRCFVNSNKISDLVSSLKEAIAEDFAR